MKAFVQNTGVMPSPELKIESLRNGGFGMSLQALQAFLGLPLIEQHGVTNALVPLGQNNGSYRTLHLYEGNAKEGTKTEANGHEPGKKTATFYIGSGNLAPQEGSRIIKIARAFSLDTQHADEMIVCFGVVRDGQTVTALSFTVKWENKEDDRAIVTFNPQGLGLTMPQSDAEALATLTILQKFIRDVSKGFSPDFQKMKNDLLARQTTTKGLRSTGQIRVGLTEILRDITPKQVQLLAAAQRLLPR